MFDLEGLLDFRRGSPGRVIQAPATASPSQIPEGGSRAASLGQATGSALAAYLANRKRQSDRDSAAAAAIEQMNPIAEALRGTGNPVLQSLTPEILAANPEMAQTLIETFAKQAAKPAEADKPDAGVASIEAALAASDRAREAGDERRASIFESRAASAAGVQVSELDKTRQMLGEAGFMPGTPEYQTALRQQLGVLPEGVTPVIKEGLDADGNPIFGMIDPQTGEARPVTGLTPRATTAESQAAELDAILSEGLPEGALSVLPEGIDPGRVFGLSGALTEATNTIVDAMPFFDTGGLTDTVGLTDAKAQEAATALDRLQGLTQLSLQASVPGRPSVFLLETIRDKFTVTPNSVFTGPDKALAQFKGTARLIQSELGRMEREVFERPGSYDAKTLAGTRRNYAELKGLLGDYQRMVDTMEGKREAAAGAPPSGVDPMVWEAMTAEERALFTPGR